VQTRNIIHTGSSLQNYISGGIGGIIVCRCNCYSVWKKDYRWPKLEEKSAGRKAVSGGNGSPSEPANPVKGEHKMVETQNNPI